MCNEYFICVVSTLYVISSETLKNEKKEKNRTPKPWEISEKKKNRKPNPPKKIGGGGKKKQEPLVPVGITNRY